MTFWPFPYNLTKGMSNYSVAGKGVSSLRDLRLSGPPSVFGQPNCTLHITNFAANILFLKTKSICLSFLVIIMC
jgi:hypothetical protein